MGRRATGLTGSARVSRDIRSLYQWQPLGETVVVISATNRGTSSRCPRSPGRTFCRGTGGRPTESPGCRQFGGYTANRYYDPATEQFISVDPLVSQTGQPFSLSLIHI